MLCFVEKKKTPYMFGWCEKVERGKTLLFDLEENEMIENTIYLNLLSYNFFIKIFYKDKKKKKYCWGKKKYQMFDLREEKRAHSREGMG